MKYHSPEYLARRRRYRVRRRRVLVGVLLTIVVSAIAAALVLGDRHHVVVVRVPARAHASAARVAAPSEYQAAPGAASLRTVRGALAKIDNERHDITRNALGGLGVLFRGDAQTSFLKLAASLGGHIELAARPVGSGKTVVFGGDEPAHGWSTTKVPVLVALLRARGSAGLTGNERDWARSAITESSNESVLALFGDLEQIKGGLYGASRYIESLLRLGGDDETAIATGLPPPGAATTFGQTRWSPGNSVRFFRALALGCLLPIAERDYVLGLMEEIEAGESWGLGSAGFASVAFKGGWGPERGGYLVRQSGIIDPSSSHGVAVAIVAFAPDFDEGTVMLTRVANWLRKHLRLSSHPTGTCAGG